MCEVKNTGGTKECRFGEKGDAVLEEKKKGNGTRREQNFEASRVGKIQKHRGGGGTLV